MTPDIWIEQCFNGFSYPLTLNKVKGGGLVIIKFTGIAPEIEGRLAENGSLEIIVSYKDDFWDIIAEFDLLERRSPSGEYYCELCPPEHREYFSSRELMWEKHSIQPLKEWCNDNFVASCWICLFATDGGGSTWAKLCHKKEVDKLKSKKYFVHAFPLVQRLS